MAVFAFDHEGALRLVNRAGERLLAQSAERLLGRTAEQVGLADQLCRGRRRVPWTSRSPAARDDGKYAADRSARTGARTRCSSSPT